MRGEAGYHKNWTHYNMQDSKRNGTLDSAIRLSKQGVAVHWLKPNSKAPLNEGWSTAKVMTLDALKETYREGYNVGVRLGEPSQFDGLYLHVIDMDIKRPESKDECLDKLVELFPDVHSWPTVKSGSGGLSRHFYFFTDKPFASRKLAKSKGTFKGKSGATHRDWEIELFGTLKQVAAPPSIHPDTGLKYEWLREIDFRAMALGVGPIIDSADVHGTGSMVAAKGGAELDDDYAELVELAHRRARMGLTNREIEGYLAPLPSEWWDDRDLWVKAGMAIHHETGGDRDGLSIYDKFSKESDKYTSFDDVKKRWTSFGKYSGDRIPYTFTELVKETNPKEAKVVTDFQGLHDLIDEADTYYEAIDAVAGASGWLLDSQLTSLMPSLHGLARDMDLKPTVASTRKDIKQRAASMAAAASQQAEEGGRMFLEDWGVRAFLRECFPGRTIMALDGSIWSYNNGFWSLQGKQLVKSEVSRFITTLHKSEDERDAELLKAIKDLGETRLSSLVSSFSDSVINYISRGDVDDPMKLLEPANKHKINFRNCELWFYSSGRTEKRPHDPSSMALSALSVNYRPRAKCDRWLDTLDDIFLGDPDRDNTIDRLQELFGYILQDSREKPLFALFKGVGANGKTLISSVLSKLMGSGLTTMSINAMNPDRANDHLESDLVGKRLIVDDDYEMGALLPDGALKKITESKTMKANPKYKGSFIFNCRATPLMLANHWPKTRDNSHGMARRGMVWEFKRIFEPHEQDLSLYTKLLEEMEGIAMWAVDGYARYLENDRVFTHSETCEAAKQKWLDNRTGIAQYVAERLVLTGNQASSVKGTDLMSDYLNWHDGDSTKALSRIAFYNGIAEIPGVERIDPGQNRIYHYTGISLISNRKDLLEDLDDRGMSVTPRKKQKPDAEQLFDVFLKEEVLISGKSSDKVGVQTFHTRFTEWLQNQGCVDEMVTLRRVCKILSNYQSIEQKGEGAMVSQVLHGVKLLD